MTPRLPEEALAALRSLQSHKVGVGDLWWVPKARLGWFPGKPKDRYCMVVAIESTPGGDIVHLVAGTGNTDNAASTIILPDTQDGISKETAFKFKFSGDLPAQTLVAEGRPVGKVSPAVVAQIATAVLASGRPILKAVCK